MSLFLNKFKYKQVKTISDSESEEIEDEEEDEQTENKKQTEKSTYRGQVADLLANLDSSDSEEETQKPKTKYNNGGIYTMIVNQTKKEKKNINTKFNTVDKNILVENTKLDNEEKKETIDNETLNSSSAESEILDDVVQKKKKFEKEDSPIPLSPPPPPSDLNKKPKRKSTSAVDKQLKELELIKNKTEINRLLEDQQDALNSDQEDDETITVRVSTKSGLYKWELNVNESFLSIFEKLSKIENTKIENLVLMLKDRIINFTDTPSSINLKFYDIIDCGKTTNTFQEKIKIIENEDDSALDYPSNMLIVILQTQEGRKSRLKLLISKEEKFENVLKKYCEKKNLDFNSHIIEFDGDKVSLSETPNDLDLDGGECFDIRKSNKPVLQHVQENNDKYKFDDDILIA